MPAVTGRDKFWPLFHFWWRHPWPKLALSTVYTKVLQEEKIFSMISTSEWSGQWGLKYSRKCSEIRVKNSKQNFLDYAWLLHASLNSPFPGICKASAVGQSLQQNYKKRRKRKKTKEKTKSLKTYMYVTQTFDFCACPSENVIKSLCKETKERHAAKGFLLRLHLMWLIFGLKMSRKSVFWGKKTLGVNGLTSLMPAYSLLIVSPWSLIHARLS